MATKSDETLEAGTLSFELARVAPRPGLEPGTSGVDVVPSAFATKVVNLDDAPGVISEFCEKGFVTTRG